MAKRPQNLKKKKIQLVLINIIRQVPNEFMKSSFLPKDKQKVVKISALTTWGRNPDNPASNNVDKY